MITCTDPPNASYYDPDIAYAYDNLGRALRKSRGASCRFHYIFRPYALTIVASVLVCACSRDIKSHIYQDSGHLVVGFTENVGGPFIGRVLGERKISPCIYSLTIRDKNGQTIWDINEPKGLCLALPEVRIGEVPKGFSSSVPVPDLSRPGRYEVQTMAGGGQSKVYISIRPPI